MSMKREKALEVLTRYAKARLKKENFVYCIGGRVRHDNKEWGIYSMADCNTMPEHRGRLFLRLQRQEGYTTCEREVWLDELDDSSLNSIVERTSALFPNSFNQFIE